MYTNTSEWTNALDAELRRVEAHRSLYAGSHEAYFITAENRVLRFRYVPENLLRAMSERLADLAFPSPPKLLPDLEDANEETYKASLDDIERIRMMVGFDDILYPTAVRCSYAGYADWRIVIDSVTGQPFLSLCGSQANEICSWELVPGVSRTPIAVNFWYDVTIADPALRNATKTYKVRERNTVNDGTLTLTRTAFDKAKSNTTTGGLEQVPWSTVAGAWPKDRIPAPLVVVKGISQLPAFRINNVDSYGDGVGDTDYTEDRKAFQDAVNIIVSSRQFAVRQLEDPVIAIRSDMIGEQGTSSGFVDPDQYKQIITNNEGEMMPVQVTNWQSNLPGSEFQWEKLEDSWYKITPLCRELDGKVEGYNLSGYARRLSLMKLETTVGRRRRSFERAFSWMLDFVHDYEGTTDRSVSISIDWPPVVPDDPNEVTQRLSRAYQDNAISRETYVATLHPDWNPEQVRVELAKIEDDIELRAVMETPIPPQGPEMKEEPTLGTTPRGGRPAGSNKQS